MTTDKNIDWPAIRQDFEKGIPLRQIELKYQVPKSTIDRRSKMGQWNGTKWDKPIPPLPEPVDVPIQAVQLAHEGLKDLQLIQRGLPSTMLLKEHTSFAQALTQYVKVIAAAPPAIPLSNELGGDELAQYMTPEHVAQFQRMQAEVLAIKLASELERKQA